MSSQTTAKLSFLGEDGDFPSGSATSAQDLVLFSQPAMNPAYTLVFGVVAFENVTEGKLPLKYVFGQRRITPGVHYNEQWFNTTQDFNPSDRIIVPLSSCPGLSEHPERLAAARNLATLAAHFAGREMVDWQSFVEAFGFSLTAQGSPRERFDRLKEQWKLETRLLSSTTEMYMHPAYQQIIGMGILAVPLILAELEKAPDHWFWALKAIFGEDDDPVTDAERGDIEMMAKAWLEWARLRRKTLTDDWSRLLVRVKT